jgi:hypothetical protein
LQSRGEIVKATTFKAFLLGCLTLSLAACAPGAAISSAERAVQAHLPGSSPSSSPGAAAVSNGSAQAAIQLVITRGNLEQEQAIARRDSSVMKDTSTDSYFQQVAQQNQDLLDNGVTAIKLVNLQWGAVTINGNSASATDDETWSTTYSDGSTDQATDRNVYTLVQQNGVWRIQADDQPGNASSSPAASAQPSASPAPATRPGGSRRPGGPAASGSTAPSPRPPSSPLAISAPSGSVEAAIQQLILRGNSEQEQAISSGDSSVMKDTSTDPYYQDLAQNNQDMLDNGVSAIKIIGIEWGAVTVKGATATATTYETWLSNYSDGTTDQSRDRNVYTLVQQNGLWKIQSDDHPDDGFTTVPGGSPPANPAPSANGGSPSPQVPPAPRLPRGRGQSSNWSGYAATGGNFTSVSGTWTVPQPATGGSLGADAAWVGIGGTNSRDLIQAGTEETVLNSGRVRYNAWIEMLPQYSHSISLAIHPGDSVTVSIAQQQPGTWQISFKNNTTGGSYDQNVQYTSSLSSAEWVEEAPSGGRGGVLPLDNFGTLPFSNASATKDGKTVNLSQAGAQPITMINGRDEPLATPSAISQDGSGFSVTRTGNSSTRNPR